MGVASSGLSSSGRDLYGPLGCLYNRLTVEATSSRGQRKWGNESYRALQQHAPSALEWTRAQNLVFQPGRLAARKADPLVHQALQRILISLACTITSTSSHATVLDPILRLGVDYRHLHKLRYTVDYDGVTNANQLHTDFYDRTHLATWVRCHPGLILWVRERVGRALVGWHPYGPWSGAAEGVAAEYLLDDTLRLHLGSHRDAPTQSVAHAID